MSKWGNANSLVEIEREVNIDFGEAINESCRHDSFAGMGWGERMRLLRLFS